MAQRELIKIIFFVLASIWIASCSPRESKDFDKAESLIKDKNFSAAVDILEKIILLNHESPYAGEAAREGARVSQLDLKDFKKAVYFLESLVLISNSDEERQLSQKQIALLYFDQIADYKKAIQELNKAIITIKNEDERNEFRLKLAKAYYFSSNFSQAESEVSLVLSKSKDSGLIFQAILLKGNIYLAEKNIPKAILMYNDLFEKFPERAVKENAAMTLAVAYEEMKDYKSAIGVLEKMRKYHSTPEYIDLRIAKLSQSQKNLPGARGARRK